MLRATALNQQDPRNVHYKGVKPENFKCPFNELKKFHVTDPALAPCIAHDILSGLLEQDLPHLINHFVRTRTRTLFSASTLLFYNQSFAF